MAPIRSSVLIPFVNEAFDARGVPVNPLTESALSITLDDLAWWSAALEKALAGLTARSAGARPLVVEARIDPSQYEAQF